MGLEGIVNHVDVFHVAKVKKVPHLQGLFHFFYTLLREYNGATFFVHLVIHIFFEPSHYVVNPVVNGCGFFGGSGNYKGSPGLVNEDGIHLVYYGVIVAPLDYFLYGILHVVPQVIKTELVVGPVGYVRKIGLLSGAWNQFGGKPFPVFPVD